MATDVELSGWVPDWFDFVREGWASASNDVNPANNEDRIPVRFKP